MSQSFSRSYVVEVTPDEIYHHVLDVSRWWSGLHNEVIEGESQQIGDEFSFKAGNGAHYSKQRLIELVPNEKIVWQVIDSNLSFLDKTDEWTGTKITFTFLAIENGTEVTFTHEGLLPEIECYDTCSTAWAKYLDRFLLG